MNIPDPIVYTAIASLVGLQTWVVREIFALKQALAELKQHRPTPSRRSIVSLLIVTIGPWLGFVLLVSGCGLVTR